MSIDFIPMGVVFVATALAVMLSIEVGYRLGRMAHRRAEDEKESPVSAMAGAILGLGGFMLAFTFSIVSNRYDARKELVRDEANIIHRVWHRADFLPEQDQTRSKLLIREYISIRLESVLSGDLARVKEAIPRTAQIQRQLWGMAVANARKDMNSDVAALYIDSLNEMFEIHARRVAIGLQVRVPVGIWLALLGITVLGMIAVGYQMGIAGSRRSMGQPILAMSFALVIELIALLDRPSSSIMSVPQQPLIDVRSLMEEQTSSPGS